MPNAEQRARQLSCLYYNQGLERASVRDLYGAEVKLRQSLQLNKRNTHARNLLGLVCYETGDVVNALQEWMISQHFQAKDNIASVYLKKVQADKATLQILTDNIKTYNRALENCTCYTLWMDPALNTSAYIMPGLGDAGDRLNGCDKKENPRNIIQLIANYGSTINGLYHTQLSKIESVVLD